MAEPVSLSDDEAAFVECLEQHCEEARIGRVIATDFSRILRERDAATLAAWLTQAQYSGILGVTNFAATLSRELTAVAAALSLEISSGQVEGQVNRLKLVKRTM